MVDASREYGNCATFVYVICALGLLMGLCSQNSLGIEISWVRVRSDEEEDRDAGVLKILSLISFPMALNWLRRIQSVLIVKSIEAI